MKKNTLQKGFTLLETMIAIFVLTLSITGPVYIASVAFHNTIDSRDNISAQYIAEEVIEVIRNARDAYVLENTDASGWLAQAVPGVNCSSPIGSSDVRCIMERDPSAGYVFNACPLGGDCPQISFAPEGTDAVYGRKDEPNVSKFRREFYFETYPGNPDEVTLVVNIVWEDKGRPKLYTLSERLYSMNYREFFKPE
jgi:prepilin-type N-terminal cleavage/methylation domain-containing protein